MVSLRHLLSFLGRRYGRQRELAHAPAGVMKERAHLCRPRSLTRFEAFGTFECIGVGQFVRREIARIA